jgi:hypothetical protein
MHPDACDSTQASRQGCPDGSLFDVRHVGVLRSAETLTAHADRQAQHDPTSGKFNSRIVNSPDITGPNAATARLQTVQTLATF